MLEIIHTTRKFRKERIEAIEKLQRETTTLIPIENHRGTRFYALITVSEYGRIYIDFVGKHFSPITGKSNLDKFQVWYDQYQVIEARFKAWLRNPEKNTFPYERDLKLVDMYLNSIKSKS